MKRGKDLHQIPHGKTVRSTAENRQPAWASHPPCAPSPMPQTKASGSELPPLRPHQHPREMTDKGGNLPWFGIYTGWDRLKEETKVTDSAYQPFRLQNQYADRETGPHDIFFRYYEPDAGWFVSQDPIGLWGGDNLYRFSSNIQIWIDPLGLACIPNPNRKNDEDLARSIDKLSDNLTKK